jgi:DNA replication and repair protein RecF
VHVTHLGLVDFRSYAQVELDLGPGVTTLLGPNGQGKTNLVEAIGYAATGRSHRVATDGPLVRVGAAQAVVRVEVVRAGRPVLVELEITPGRANRARVNRAPVPRQRDALGHVARVLFCPEDLSLVKGDPGERRAFLDDLLVSLAPRYDGVLADLERVLRQRNALLKSASALRGGGLRARTAAEQTLSVWDDQLVSLGAELVVARAHLVARLAGPIDLHYRAVAPEDRDPRVGVAYACGVPGVGRAQEPGVAAPTPAELPDRTEVGEALREALARRRDEEFARGITLVGPHRDEVLLSLHDLPLRGYASHGESWSMALALRLASYDLLRADVGTGGDPVLVLDDVFAELDTSRRERLAGLVAGVEQVLVTAAVAEDVPAALAGRIVAVGQGTVGAA